MHWRFSAHGEDRDDSFDSNQLSEKPVIRQLAEDTRLLKALYATIDIHHGRELLEVERLALLSSCLELGLTRQADRPRSVDRAGMAGNLRLSRRPKAVRLKLPPAAAQES